MQIAQFRARAKSIWLGAAFVLAIGACSKDVVNPDVGAVDSVVIDPRTASIFVGSSLALSAEVLAVSGEVLPSVTIVWASEDSSIAQVSQTGIVTGLKAGTVRVAASAWGKNAVATITVNPALGVLPAVSRIVIAPTNPRILEGQTIQLTAAVLDADNRVITGMTITWSSSNTNRATVDNTGLVRGISDGNANISASAGGKTGTTTVRVDK